MIVSNYILLIVDYASQSYLYSVGTGFQGTITTTSTVIIWTAVNSVRWASLCQSSWQSVSLYSVVFPVNCYHKSGCSRIFSFRYILLWFVHENNCKTSAVCTIVLIHPFPCYSLIFHVPLRFRHLRPSSWSNCKLGSDTSTISPSIRTLFGRSPPSVCMFSCFAQRWL